jgi:hypothetical protein
MAKRETKIYKHYTENKRLNKNPTKHYTENKKMNKNQTKHNAKIKGRN